MANDLRAAEQQQQLGGPRQIHAGEGPSRTHDLQAYTSIASSTAVCMLVFLLALNIGLVWESNVLGACSERCNGS